MLPLIWLPNNMNKKSTTFLLFLLFLLGYFFFYSKGNLSYFKLNTTLNIKQVNRWDIINHYDNFENFTFISLRIKNVEQFVQENEQYRISDHNFKWEYYLPDKKWLPVNLSPGNSYSSKKGDVLWAAYLDTANKILFIECNYPDFSGN
jgi:hypothetical protein